jgi:flagellar biosynthesis activator protein FlaF
MSNAAQAYARTAHSSTPPRQVEAQALLKAARQLQDVQKNWSGPDQRMHAALLFNRQLWSIFMSAAESNENPQPLEIREQIANIGVFVMKQTVDMQLVPAPEKLKSLIEINCNIAAGLSGRA